MNTNHKFEDAVSDICRLTLKAQLDAPVDREKREAFFKRMLADVMVGSSSLFVDIEKVPSTVMEGAVKAEEQSNPLDLLPGVRMVSFRGPNYARFVATRRHPATPWGFVQAPDIFEIYCDHDDDIAHVTRNGKDLFHIVGTGVGHCVVKKLAISALRRYLRDCVGKTRATKRRKARNRAAAEGKEA